MEDLVKSTCSLIVELGDAEEKLETYKQIIKAAEDLAIKGLRTENGASAKDAYLQQIARVLGINES